MKRKIVLSTLLIETLFAIMAGITSCTNEPSQILKIISFLLLFISFAGVLFLFSQKNNNSKRYIMDLVLAVINISINHFMLGMVFGWNECPMI